MNKKQWLPLIGMTIAAFIFNTSEFMPIGLLTDIAQTFHITQTTAGTMITIYSWAVMLLSLPLMILASKYSYKKILLTTLFLFALGQGISAIAFSFPLLIIGRLVVACAHAIFWSIASVVAVRLVHEDKREFAMSMIVTGTSVAMIVGLPLGRMIGLLIGWRITFLMVGIISVLLLIFQTIYLPKLQTTQAFTLNELPDLLKNKQLITIYGISLLFASAYYTAYSYIEPFLAQVAKLSNNSITLVLSLFGVAGIGGSYLFSKFYNLNRKRFILISLFCLTIVLFVLKPSTASIITLLLICVVWGMSSTAFNVACQSETILVTNEQTSSIAMSIFSGIFNLGIGLGSFIGGQTINILNIQSIGYIAGIIGILSVIFYIRRR
ncbi:MFS transporter [Eubacterium sp. AF22-8LB]|uniref:MFS transporter n=1 Tax=Eubacterium sp. AF22-8LB TaxID=2292232 RepID=UPI000E526F29|nr:MFS transporter [Eubacterium sp. AF22-8LB]RGS31526.1 MFS transporter [Eubacterium sp. AF22-8LB]